MGIIVYLFFEVFGFKLWVPTGQTLSTFSMLPDTFKVMPDSFMN
jgi:hypothetical protein